MSVIGLTELELKQWYHYEEIAMHFNSLIIQYRLQIMGGTGALGAALGYLVTTQFRNVLERAKVRVIAAWFVVVLFAAAASLDLFY